MRTRKLRVRRYEQNFPPHAEIEILHAELISVRADLAEVKVELRHCSVIAQESRAAQVGTLEGKLLGTELSLAKARKDLDRYRSEHGELNVSRELVCRVVSGLSV